MKQFRIILASIFVIIVVIFSVQNAEAVSVRFLSWGIDVSLALLMVLCMVLGAFSIGLLFLPSIFKKKKNTSVVHSTNPTIHKPNNSSV